MKKNCWSIFGMLVATSLLAQPASNPPAAPLIETPAPAPLATNVAPAAPSNESTNAPAAKKKKAAPKKRAKNSAPKSAAAELKTVPLVAGPAVVDANHVNVRGQGKLKSEIVTRLNKGQEVTVLQEIVRNNSGREEPSAWAKILLPTNVPVYVHSRFIDTNNLTVRPKILNVRSGPGENYSVLGQLRRGEPVKQLGAKGDWLEVEAPTNAYAFIASQYLKQEAPSATPTPTEPTPAPTTVAEAPAIAAAPTEPPAAAPSITPEPTEAPAVTNPPPETAAAPATPAAEEPPPKRIVQREGKVRATVSIQAPTRFELYSPDTGRTIDYIYTSSPNLDLRRYKGLGIVVTGEESLEERWGNTPVITIQKIQVLDEGP